MVSRCGENEVMPWAGPVGTPPARRRGGWHGGTGILSAGYQTDPRCLGHRMGVWLAWLRKERWLLKNQPESQFDDQPRGENFKNIQCICIPCVVVETQSTEGRPSRRRARILDPRRMSEKFIAVSGLSRVTASGCTPRAVHALWHFGSWRAGAPSPESSK